MRQKVSHTSRDSISALRALVWHGESAALIEDGPKGTDCFTQPVRTDMYRTCIQDIKDADQDSKSRLLCDSLVVQHTNGLLLASLGGHLACQGHSEGDHVDHQGHNNTETTRGESTDCQSHTKGRTPSNGVDTVGPSKVAPNQEVDECHRARTSPRDEGLDSDGTRPQCNGNTALLDEVHVETVAVNLQTLIDGVIGKKFYKPTSDSITVSVDGNTDSLEQSLGMGRMGQETVRQGTGDIGKQHPSPSTSCTSNVESARCGDDGTGLQQTHFGYLSKARQLSPTECPHATVDMSCHDTAQQSVSVSSPDDRADPVLSCSRVDVNLQTLIEGVIGKKYYRSASDSAAKVAASGTDTSNNVTHNWSVGDRSVTDTRDHLTHNWSVGDRSVTDTRDNLTHNWSVGDRSVTDTRVNLTHSWSVGDRSVGQGDSV